MYNYRRDLERRLDSFKNASDWSDFISMLGAIEKTIDKMPPIVDLDELPVFLLQKRLHQCLNPILPSGVHNKVIKVYSLIVQKMKQGEKYCDEIFESESPNYDSFMDGSSFQDDQSTLSAPLVSPNSEYSYVCMKDTHESRLFPQFRCFSDFMNERFEYFPKDDTRRSEGKITFYEEFSYPNENQSKLKGIQIHENHRASDARKSENTKDLSQTSEKYHGSQIVSEIKHTTKKNGTVQKQLNSYLKCEKKPHSVEKNTEKTQILLPNSFQRSKSFEDLQSLTLCAGSRSDSQNANRSRVLIVNNDKSSIFRFARKFLTDSASNRSSIHHNYIDERNLLGHLRSKSDQFQYHSSSYYESSLDDLLGAMSSNIDKKGKNSSLILKNNTNDLFSGNSTEEEHLSKKIIIKGEKNGVKAGQRVNIFQKNRNNRDDKLFYSLDLEKSYIDTKKIRNSTIFWQDELFEDLSHLPLQHFEKRFKAFMDMEDKRRGEKAPKNGRLLFQGLLVGLFSSIIDSHLQSKEKIIEFINEELLELKTVNFKIYARNILLCLLSLIQEDENIAKRANQGVLKLLEKFDDKKMFWAHFFDVFSQNTKHRMGSLIFLAKNPRFFEEMRTERDNILHVYSIAPKTKCDRSCFVIFYELISGFICKKSFHHDSFSRNRESNMLFNELSDRETRRGSLLFDWFNKTIFYFLPEATVVNSIIAGLNDSESLVVRNTLDLLNRNFPVHDFNLWNRLILVHRLFTLLTLRNLSFSKRIKIYIQNHLSKDFRHSCVQNSIYPNQKQNIFLDYLVLSYVLILDLDIESAAGCLPSILDIGKTNCFNMLFVLKNLQKHERCILINESNNSLFFGNPPNNNESNFENGNHTTTCDNFSSRSCLNNTEKFKKIFHTDPAPNENEFEDITRGKLTKNSTNWTCSSINRTSSIVCEYSINRKTVCDHYISQKGKKGEKIPIKNLDRAYLQYLEKTNLIQDYCQLENTIKTLKGEKCSTYHITIYLKILLVLSEDEDICSFLLSKLILKIMYLIYEKRHNVGNMDEIKYFNIVLGNVEINQIWGMLFIALRSKLDNLQGFYEAGVDKKDDLQRSTLYSQCNPINLAGYGQTTLNKTPTEKHSDHSTLRKNLDLDVKIIPNHSLKHDISEEKSFLEASCEIMDSHKTDNNGEFHKIQKTNLGLKDTLQMFKVHQYEKTGTGGSTEQSLSVKDDLRSNKSEIEVSLRDKSFVTKQDSESVNISAFNEEAQLNLWHEKVTNHHKNCSEKDKSKYCLIENLVQDSEHCGFVIQTEFEILKNEVNFLEQDLYQFLDVLVYFIEFSELKNEEYSSFHMQNIVFLLTRYHQFIESVIFAKLLLFLTKYMEKMELRSYDYLSLDEINKYYVSLSSELLDSIYYRFTYNFQKLLRPILLEVDFVESALEILTALRVRKHGLSFDAAFEIQIIQNFYCKILSNIKKINAIMFSTRSEDPKIRFHNPKNLRKKSKKDFLQNRQNVVQKTKLDKRKGNFVEAPKIEKLQELRGSDNSLKPETTAMDDQHSKKSALVDKKASNETPNSSQLQENTLQKNCNVLLEGKEQEKKRSRVHYVDQKSKEINRSKKDKVSDYLKFAHMNFRHTISDSLILEFAVFFENCENSETLKYARRNCIFLFLVLLDNSKYEILYKLNYIFQRQFEILVVRLVSKSFSQTGRAPPMSSEGENIYCNDTIFYEKSQAYQKTQNYQQGDVNTFSKRKKDTEMLKNSHWDLNYAQNNDASNSPKRVTKKSPKFAIEDKSIFTPKDKNHQNNFDVEKIKEHNIISISSHNIDSKFLKSRDSSLDWTCVKKELSHKTNHIEPLESDFHLINFANMVYYDIVQMNNRENALKLTEERFINILELIQYCLTTKDSACFFDLVIVINHKVFSDNYSSEIGHYYKENFVRFIQSLRKFEHLFEFLRSSIQKEGYSKFRSKSLMMTFATLKNLIKYSAFFRYHLFKKISIDYKKSLFNSIIKKPNPDSSDDSVKIDRDFLLQNSYSSEIPINSTVGLFSHVKSRNINHEKLPRDIRDKKLIDELSQDPSYNGFLLGTRNTTYEFPNCPRVGTHQNEKIIKEEALDDLIKSRGSSHFKKSPNPINYLLKTQELSRTHPRTCDQNISEDLEFFGSNNSKIDPKFSSFENNEITQYSNKIQQNNASSCNANLKIYQSRTPETVQDISKFSETNTELAHQFHDRTDSVNQNLIYKPHPDSGTDYMFQNSVSDSFGSEGSIESPKNCGMLRIQSFRDVDQIKQYARKQQKTTKIHHRQTESSIENRNKFKYNLKVAKTHGEILFLTLLDLFERCSDIKIHIQILGLMNLLYSKNIISCKNINEFKYDDFLEQILEINSSQIYSLIISTLKLLAVKQAHLINLFMSKITPDLYCDFLDVIFTVSDEECRINTICHVIRNSVHFEGLELILLYYLENLDSYGDGEITKVVLEISSKIFKESKKFEDISRLIKRYQNFSCKRLDKILKFLNKPVTRDYCPPSRNIDCDSGRYSASKNSDLSGAGQQKKSISSFDHSKCSETKNQESEDVGMAKTKMTIQKNLGINSAQSLLNASKTDKFDIFEIQKVLHVDYNRLMPTLSSLKMQKTRETSLVCGLGPFQKCFRVNFQRNHQSEEEKKYYKSLMSPEPVLDAGNLQILKNLGSVIEKAPLVSSLNQCFNFSKNPTDGVSIMEMIDLRSLMEFLTNSKEDFSMNCEKYLHEYNSVQNTRFFDEMIDFFLFCQANAVKKPLGLRDDSAISSTNSEKYRISHKKEASCIERFEDFRNFEPFTSQKSEYIGQNLRKKQLSGILTLWEHSNLEISQTMHLRLLHTLFDLHSKNILITNTITKILTEHFPELFLNILYRQKHLNPFINSSAHKLFLYKVILEKLPYDKVLTLEKIELGFNSDDNINAIMSLEEYIQRLFELRTKNVQIEKYFWALNFFFRIGSRITESKSICDLSIKVLDSIVTLIARAFKMDQKTKKLYLTLNNEIKAKSAREMISKNKPFRSFILNAGLENIDDYHCTDLEREICSTHSSDSVTAFQLQHRRHRKKEIQSYFLTDYLQIFTESRSKVNHNETSDVSIGKEQKNYTESISNRESRPESPFYLPDHRRSSSYVQNRSETFSGGILHPFTGNQRIDENDFSSSETHAGRKSYHFYKPESSILAPPQQIQNKKGQCNFITRFHLEIGSEVVTSRKYEDILKIDEKTTNYNLFFCKRYLPASDISDVLLLFLAFNATQLFILLKNLKLSEIRKKFLNCIFFILKSSVTTHQIYFLQFLNQLIVMPEQELTFSREVFDFLLSPQFFEKDLKSMKLKYAIVKKTLAKSKQALNVILERLDGSIFTSKELEMTQKAEILKRIAFILLCSEIDSFSDYLPKISQIISLRIQSSHLAVKKETILLMLVCFLRFSHKSLFSLIPILFHEILVQFDEATKFQAFNNNSGYLELILSILFFVFSIDDSDLIELSWLFCKPTSNFSTCECLIFSRLASKKTKEDKFHRNAIYTIKNTNYSPANQSDSFLPSEFTAHPQKLNKTLLADRNISIAGHMHRMKDSFSLKVEDCNGDGHLTKSLEVASLQQKHHLESMNGKKAYNLRVNDHIKALTASYAENFFILTDSLLKKSRYHLFTPLDRIRKKIHESSEKLECEIQPKDTLVVPKSIYPTLFDLDGLRILQDSEIGDLIDTYLSNLNLFKRFDRSELLEAVMTLFKP